MKRGQPLRRTGRLPYRSRKRIALMVARRKLVADLLAERPVCERCQQARSDDVHEVVSRARGGSVLAVDNLRCLCRPCHTWVTENPAQALAEGWLRNSWQREAS